MFQEDVATLNSCKNKHQNINISTETATTAIITAWHVCYVQCPFEKARTAESLPDDEGDDGDPGSGLGPNDGYDDDGEGGAQGGNGDSASDPSSGGSHDEVEGDTPAPTKSRYDVDGGKRGCDSGPSSTHGPEDNGGATPEPVEASR